MSNCKYGHNFVDKGSNISCTKCGLTYLKKLRNKKKCEH